MIVPTIGADGVAGCALITTSADADDVHPAALVTVNVYVPAAKPLIVVLAPLPVVVAPQGRTLGGGCEMTLHSDLAQAAAETYIGLVESVLDSSRVVVEQKNSPNA